MGMPASHTLVFALVNGATGLTVPVLTLMLLARGATLETLSLFMGITLAVTVALEVPSGIAADVLGRKRLFMIAMLLNVAGYVLLAAGVSAWLVAALDGSYVTFYLFVGAWSVFEQTLLHQAAPACERSSMMSVQSIALRTGGFAASAAGVPLGAALSLPWIWLVFALFSVLPLLFSARGAGSRRAAGSCRTEGI